MDTIHVRASHAKVRAVLASLPSYAAGSMIDPVRMLLVRMGLVILGRIKHAFVVKARGGVDETGLSWPPLSPYTIAYSRRHPRVPRKKARARDAPSWNLKKRQRERWWHLYYKYLSAFKGDKSHAAAAAWRVLKSEGARTMMDDYGGTKVEILRDTNALFDSLTPGASPDAGLSDPPKQKDQIFRLGPGEVIIGTSRKWAKTHHEGTSRIPQRRLWPEPRAWPRSWWEEIASQGLQGIIEIIWWLLSRGG